MREVDRSFHSPEWHAARLESLKTSHTIEWEEYKEQQKWIRESRRQRKVAYLPSEIIFDILSRLPIRTAMSCKLVCKPWLALLRTPEFAIFHLSKSVPWIAVFEFKPQPKPYRILDECTNIVFNLSLPFHEELYSSVNGLLFVRNHFLCNPITREYLKLPSPPAPSSQMEKNGFGMEVYGFGVSKMSGQYKVVRIFVESGAPLELHECQVYTVGTRLWRGIALDSTLRYEKNTVGACIHWWYEKNTVGAFVNGNLHWLARKGFSTLISCLDLESELFNTFSVPPHDDIDKCMSLSVLGDFLCVIDNSEYSLRFAFKVNIWLMKEYGDEKSWTKEFVIHIGVCDTNLQHLLPIKVFNDGDILIATRCAYNCKLVYYSSKTKTFKEVYDAFGLQSRNFFTSITVFTPSFLSLKTFARENVASFY